MVIPSRFGGQQDKLVNWGRPTRWKGLFRDHTHLAFDTILAVIQALKNYENSNA